MNLILYLAADYWVPSGWEVMFAVVQEVVLVNFPLLQSYLQTHPKCLCFLELLVIDEDCQVFLDVKVQFPEHSEDPFG